MMIYFCDRQFNILGQATTELPSGFRISEDKLVEDVESGVNTFECTVTWTDESRSVLTKALTAGNYILKSGRNDNNYNQLFQIIETESDTKAQEIRLYAEDAGLDLLNTQCGAAKLEDMTMIRMLQYFLPPDWTVDVQEAPDTTRTNEWDGESTCTERLRSVVGLWDQELYYSFRIEGLQVKEKTVNVVKRRGLQEAIPQLRLNYDIDRIMTKTSISDLVTALNVTGGIPDGSVTPVDLVGYTYSYEDPVTGDVYQVDRTSGQMRNTTAMDRWSSMIDEDGLLVGSFSFDTTDKAVLAGQARAELQKRSTPSVNYEVDFAKLPDDVQIGDRVNIIDDDGDLYLEARILRIETSEAEDTQKAVIGDYLLKNSGISGIVQQLAGEMTMLADIKQNADNAIKIIEYAAGTSKVIAPSSGWSTSSPAWEAGKYVWMRQSRDGADYVYTCIQGAKGESGSKGDPGSDAITVVITTSSGSIFKDSSESTVLTAHVYMGGAEVSGPDLAALGTIKWYKDNGSSAVGTGITITVNASAVMSKAVYEARLEA